MSVIVKLIGENDTGNSIVSEDIQTNNEIIRNAIKYI